MTIPTKNHIQHILMLLLVGVLSVCSLSAQIAVDSIRSAKNNRLMDSFEGVSFEDALPQYAEADTLQPFNEDSIAAIHARLILDEQAEYEYVDSYFQRFNPSPQKAVWMAVLFPGGGQIYNRKYWKLPIIYGGFLGLVYGYNWNQRYFKTYQNAYRDLMNGSANASYLQFLPGKTEELRKQYAKNHYSYLQTTFQRKRNTYRNWRDYCVVGMLGVYLVGIVDAYVDAALYHFDVSPELDAMNNPAMVVSYKIDF